MKIIDEFRRGTLFAKTALTTTLVSSLFLIFTLSLLAIFIIVPTGQRSARNLASLVTLSADTWSRLPVLERQGFTDELTRRYQLEVIAERTDLVSRTRHPPFFVMLEEELEKQLGTKVTVLQSNIPGERHHYWIPVT